MFASGLLLHRYMDDWHDEFQTSPCSFFCGGVVTAVVIAAEVYLMGRCVGEVLASSLVQGVRSTASCATTWCRGEG